MGISMAIYSRRTFKIKMLCKMTLVQICPGVGTGSPEAEFSGNQQMLAMT